MPEVGEILETFHDERVVCFAWKIPDIFSLIENDSCCNVSPSTEVFGARWGVKMSLGGTICFTLWRNCAKYNMPFMMGIRKADGSEEILTRDKIFPKNINLFSLTEQLEKQDLVRRRSLLAPSDTLTITFIVWIDSSSVEERKFDSHETQTEELSNTAGREVNTKDVSTLQEHLKDLLLNGDDHDITIKVGNQEFRAHKNMLRARSPVFSAMFKHQMKESMDGSISIEDCDPDAFGEFLKYVYTGKVEDLSPSKAVGLYYVADKYDFSGLKEICVRFLKTSLSTTVVCDVIALAMDHGESSLLECAMNFFSKHTKEILITSEWQRFARNNFTIANELYIKVLDSFANQGE